MAAPIKENADYFTHDADASSDEKLMYLESRFGLEGYAFYFKMLEILTRANHFEIWINNITKYVYAKRIGMAPERFEEMLEAACHEDIQAFKKEAIEGKEGQKVYSPGLKKRFEPLIKKRQRDRNRVIADENPVIDNDNPVIASDYKQSRAEQSKEEQSKAKQSKANGAAKEPAADLARSLTLSDAPGPPDLLTYCRDRHAVNTKSMQKLIGRYGDAYCWRHVDQLEYRLQFHKQSGNERIDNPGAYLLESIKNGWKPPPGYSASTKRTYGKYYNEINKTSQRIS